MRQSLRTVIPLALLVALVGLMAAGVLAENVDPGNDGSQYAYGENVGWINAEPAGCSDCGMQVSDSAVTGYMWGENIGWINLNCSNTSCAGAAGTWGVTNDTEGNLLGYAYGENVGWISFSCHNNESTCASTGDYGVHINTMTGDFSGSAYGENIGWISFSDTSPYAYKVTTGWRQSTFIVNSADDDDDGTCNAAHCSLREAINTANTLAGPNTIGFNIPGGGAGWVMIIAPGSALPTITDPVTIDGTTQPGYGGSPLILLDGVHAGAGADGLAITAGGSIVKGLTINRFGGHGVHISGSAATWNYVQANYIGTDATGISALGNAGAGVLIDTGASHNQIGGGVAEERNVISGNGGGITATDADSNYVVGNYIGTKADGTGALANTGNGVLVTDGSLDNVIGDTGGTTPGGPCTGLCNVISGNGANGVQITGFATGTIVKGNYIGTDKTGASDVVGNGGAGIRIDTGAHDNTVGGTTAAERNVISANHSSGVAINGLAGSTNTVEGNYIGANAAGTGDLGNVYNGVFIEGPGNMIGGTAAGAGNLISGNDHGIHISGPTSTGNNVQGNYIGTDATGSSGLGNTGNGVLVDVLAHGNIIGGTTAAARNVISANDNGVYITSSDANNVEGNYVGTNAGGTLALANSANGVLITAFSDGSTVSGNVISGNAANGVQITGLATGSTVKGNYIGTDKTGATGVGNTGGGIRIDSGASTSTIGGTAAGERNIISANGAGLGIDLGAHHNTALGNYIGTDAGGSAALGNVYGVIIQDDAHDNTVGPMNTISNSGQFGVLIQGAGTTANGVRGNYIDHNGTSVSGVAIGGGAHDNTIGGATAGMGNTIANSGGNGVEIGSGYSNQVRRNSIHDNSSLGIDLGPGGVTANDTGDGDTGANNLQNFPVLSSATGGSSTTVIGTLNSAPSTLFVAEFFVSPTCDGSGNGEGQTFLADAPVITDGGGNAGFTMSGLPATTIGHKITVTATSGARDTSEFSVCITVTSGCTDADGDTVCDSSDNCPSVSNLNQANGDGDTLGDACDNCPATTNQDQANADGDAYGDVCDNCPGFATVWSVPAGDGDCDGFPDTTTVSPRGRENFIGTDATDRCADTVAPNDERGSAFSEPLSPWPPDFNDNRIANLSDVVAFGPHFNKVSPDPAYSARLDLNANNVVNLSDVVAMGPFFNKFCTP